MCLCREAHGRARATYKGFYNAASAASGTFSDVPKVFYASARAVYTAAMKICWAQYLQWAVFAVLALATLLSGCGQKGPLILPDQKPAQVQAK